MTVDDWLLASTMGQHLGVSEHGALEWQLFLKKMGTLCLNMLKPWYFGGPYFHIHPTVGHLMTPQHHGACVVVL